MTIRPLSHPELALHRVGRRFRQRPGDAVIREFLAHVWNTGAPQTWRWITTTPHPKGKAPTILREFNIPTRLRHGRETRAPCSICSDSAPKFDHGYLVHCPDGYLRIIGHDCGHDFFGESYAKALKTHDEETAEAAARQLLTERMPDLSRTLVEAVQVARDLRVLLDFRERAFAAITLSAVTAMRRSRVGDQLTVQVESGVSDDKGRRVFEDAAVATVFGLDALLPRAGALGELITHIRAAAEHWIVERDEVADRLREMTRPEAFAASKAVRGLDAALSGCRDMREALGQLLSEDGLRGLSAWGRHSHSPKPFWIEIVGHKVFLGRGLRPRYWDRGFFLTIPDPSMRQSLVVA